MIRSPVLVVAGEAVDDDGDGQGQDEDAEEGAESARHLAQHRRRVQVVAHGRQGHEGEPEGVDEGPDALVALGEVHEAGDGQHRHADQEEQQAQLLVGLKRNIMFVLIEIKCKLVLSGRIGQLYY